MPFVETIRNLPFSPRTPNGAGFLPPIVRAQGHILYLIGCMADETTTVTAENAISELRHALEHWNARAQTENVSTAAQTKAGIIGTAILQAIDEYEGWNDEQRSANVRDLAQRIVQYAADLDRELVGLSDSDPGSTL